MKTRNWEKAKAIFGDVLKFAPDERERFLEDACGDNKTLRREVESLLASYDDASGFLESPAVGKITDVVESNTKKLKKGFCFGHYEIIKQIGAGGMGEVYLAKDTRLDRMVAVKILNENFARHESNLNRFIQEARAASALNHPNILVIHEIGETDRAHYIISEFIGGKTLRETLNEKTLRLSEVLDISIQIAKALVAAHEAHLVHRDIKPENIMIRPDGFVKVLDFGLAKLVVQKAVSFENSTVKQNQTAKGVILGTVQYMSPEQAKGKKVDGRTDIFSFGIVIYEMLAGRTPFAGDSMSETLANLINSEPQPLARFAADVPDEFQRIVAKTLRKNADERYQTMKGVLGDLKNLQRRLEFESEFKLKNLSGANAETRELKFEKKESQPRNSIAVLPFANMSADAENEYFCDGLAEELINALVKIEDLKVAARASAFSFKNKNAEVSEIGKTLNVKTVLEGSVRKSGEKLRITVQLVNASNGFHIWSERFDGEMHDIFDLQDEITLAVIDKLKVKFLSEEKAAVLKRQTDDPKAYEYYLKGMYYRWKLSPKEFRKSGEYFHRAVETDPTFALAYFGLNSYYGYGTAWGLLNIPPEEGWAKAEAAINKGLEIDPTLPELQLSLAALKLINYREFDEAGKRIERAAANSKFPEIHHLYTSYLLIVGRFDEAVAESELALRLDPLSVSYSNSLGTSFYFARRYDDAIRQFGKSLELDPNNASAHELLGDVYQKQGKFDKAIAEWHRAMTLEGNDELADILKNVYAESDFAAAFERVAQKKIERMKAKVEKGEFVLAINFARAYVTLGDKDKAFEWLENTIEQRNVFPLLMNADPFYDELRSDSRFHRLIERIGIPVDKIETAAQISGKNDFAEKAGLKNAANKNSTAENLSRTSAIADLLVNQKRFYVFAFVILLAAAGFSYYYWFFENKTAVGKKTLAVLPFVNSGGDPNAEYLSDGITESIINDLSQISDLKVMSRNSAFRFKDNQTDIKNIASQLGVETVVTGDIKQLGDRLVINVRLIDARDESQIWGNQYVKTTRDIIAAQNEIAQAVAGNLRLKLTNAEQQRLDKKYTENIEAYQLYLKGNYHAAKLNPVETSKGISYFEQAIALDPNFALAYAGLANAYRTLSLTSDVPSKEVLPKSKAAALKALEIDNSLAEAHASLGLILFWYDWNWDEAEKQYKTALELDPNSAAAINSYAHLKSNLGRHEEAVAMEKRARELDPLSLIISSLEAQFLFYAGQPDEAFSRAQKVLELDPNFWHAHLVLTRIYIAKEMYREAINEAVKARDASHGNAESIATIGYAFAKSGRRDEAKAVLDELKKRAAERYVPPYDFALVYNGLGETDEAINWLQRAFEERDARMVFLKVEPKWNNLRNDPRFINLMKRINFDQ